MPAAASAYGAPQRTARLIRGAASKPSHRAAASVLVGRLFPSHRRPFPSSGRLFGTTTTAVAPVGESTDGTDVWAWTGSDEFSELGDRKDATPLHLPGITTRKRIVLVRHGQSTWNAEGRIQGSSDFSVLTAKGKAQAKTTMEMLETDSFQAMFHSKLMRASETAEIIWNNRPYPTVQLPLLREIDLYSFQGLLKDEGKGRFGDAYEMWKADPASFEIDGQAPVRELWYRASLVWQTILTSNVYEDCALVVAHNAVNQAMINVALGLPPSNFRRFLQSNAATTVLDFTPGHAGAPRITIDRMNQSPGLPYAPDGAGRAARARVVLVRAAATQSTESGLIPGQEDESASVLGDVQAEKVGEMLMDMRVDSLLCSPLSRAGVVKDAIQKYQTLAGHGPHAVEEIQDLKGMAMGSWTRTPARDAAGKPVPPDAEASAVFWARANRAWDSILESAAKETGGTVVVVAHASLLLALVCRSLGLRGSSMNQFRMDNGGVTILDFPDGVEADAVVRCINYTAHLGRWSVPVTIDDLDGVCGIDGCF